MDITAFLWYVENCGDPLGDQKKNFCSAPLSPEAAIVDVSHCESGEIMD